MVCLDTTRTVALVAGALRAAERLVVESHLSTCQRCRRLVSEAARDPSGPGRPTEVGFARAAACADRAPQPGDRVGRFVIRGVLGTGGMGVVYDAYDEQLLRAVALKQLRPSAGNAEASRPSRPRQPGQKDGWQEGGTEYWVQEARALARLDHPNVVTLYEVVPHAGAHFLALERVDGVTLGSWLRAPRRTEEILDVFLAAAHGLEAAHAAGIVHRDFKPDNVLVGRDGRVRVADFGLAMPLTLQSPVKAAGTPRYVAPEQARGEPPDARSDQYSFAVALLEALSGATPGTALGSRTAEAPIALAHLSGALWGVISRAMSVRPGDRFPDLAAFIAALVGARQRRRARRRLGVASAVASILVAATANAAWRAHQETIRSRARLHAAREAGAERASETARLRQRHAALAEEAAALRDRQAESAEEAEALRAQIASLVGDLSLADSSSAQVRALQRTLRRREKEIQALAQAVASGETEPGWPALPPSRFAGPKWRDVSPHPYVVERYVRRLSTPLQSCLIDSDGFLHLPRDLAARLRITAAGVTARAELSGGLDPSRRSCVAGVLATLRIPPFARPALRSYDISLSWLEIDARMRTPE
jgi:hypothetical protein